MQPGAKDVDPTVHRRRLRNELRKAREAAGKTQRDVAKAMDWSQSKLIRIETGAVNISTNDLRALLNHYGTESDRIETLVDLARAAREVPRWNAYREIASPEFIAFLGYESSASIIRNFEPLVIPGLLQTEEYARAVFTTLQPDASQEKIDGLVDLRTQRQDIFTRDPLPQLHFILDEAVIHRLVGGPEVAGRQLRHLREMTNLPNVTIRIVPFSCGIYPRLGPPYVIFEFYDAGDESILYLESRSGDYIIRENSPDDRSRLDPITYLGVFWQLEQLAPKGDALALIDHALARLADTPGQPG